MAAEIVAFPFSRRVHHLESQANVVLHQNHNAAQKFLKFANKRYQRLLVLGIPEDKAFAEASDYHAALWGALNRKAYLEGKPGLPPRTLERAESVSPQQIPEPATQPSQIKKARGRDDRSQEVPQWKELAHWCLARADGMKLNGKERAFLVNMTHVVETPTEKQITWLSDIYDALQSSKTA